MAGSTQVLSKVLTYLNDQPVELLSHMPDWEPQRKHLIPKRCFGKQPLPSHHGSTCYVVLRIPSPVTPGEGINYWDLQLNILPGWGRRDHSISTPAVLPQGRLAEMHQTCSGRRDTEKGEGEGSGLGYPAPVHLLKPDSTASPD